MQEPIKKYFNAPSEANNEFCFNPTMYNIQCL